jgi:hypothetical protein
MAVLVTVAAAEAAPKLTAGNVRYRTFRLVPSFRETGLARYERIPIEARANCVATYMCTHNSGIKKTVSSKPHNLKRFRADRRGVLRGSIELYPPVPRGLMCPHGQAMVLVQAVYSGVRITDTKHRKELRFLRDYRWRSPSYRA